MWETGDVGALVALRHEDVVATMPPIPAWFRGRDPLIEFIGSRIGEPGVQRVVRIACADHIALAFYRLKGNPTFDRHAVQVLYTEGGKVTEIHVFLDTELFAHFGLPKAGAA